MDKATIRVYSPDLTFLVEIDNYESLIFTRNYYKPSGFSITINLNNKNGAKYLQENNIIMINNNPFKTGIIQLVEPSNNEKGSQTLLIKGFTMNSIISIRSIIPPENKFYYEINSNPETIIKNLIDTNCVNPTNPKRIIPFLEIAKDKERGETIPWKTKLNTNLSNDLEDLSTISNLGNRVCLDLNKNKYIFDVWQGRDLSVNNKDNNNPVIFSHEHDNILTQKYSSSLIGYKNVCYVYKKETTTDSQGNEIVKNMVVEEVGEAEGLNRIEMGCQYTNNDNKSDEELKNELIKEGKKQLELNKKIDSFELDIEPYNGFIYEKDYFLGDIVTIQGQWGIQKDLRITEITEVCENNGDKFNVTFGKSIPTITDRIKQKLKGK